MPSAGMQRYNTDELRLERSTNEGTAWAEMDLSKSTKVILQTISDTGTVNNKAVTVASILYLRINNSSLLTLTGIVGGRNGDIIIMAAVGSARVDLVHASASSSAANRFGNIVTTGSTSLSPGNGYATYIYEGSWRLMYHEQGAYILPTFSAADYSSSSGAVTVDSTDVSIYQYKLSGRTLTVNFRIEGFTITGGYIDFRIKIPANFIPTYSLRVPCVVVVNGVYAIAFMEVHASQAYIFVYATIGGGAWTGSVNNASAYGSFSFEVS